VMERIKLEEVAEEEEREDLVVEHELKGVEPEMIDWFWIYLTEGAMQGREEATRRYKLWHPRDHLSFEGEEGWMIHRVVERIGETLPVEMRMRVENPDETPIPRSTSYTHAVASCILGKNDRPIGWVLHEYDRMPGGTKMRSTFRLPRTLLSMVGENLRRHCLEEMGEFTHFLPKLYGERRESGFPG